MRFKCRLFSPSPITIGASSAHPPSLPPSFVLQSSCVYHIYLPPPVHSPFHCPLFYSRFPQYPSLQLSRSCLFIPSLSIPYLSAPFPNTNSHSISFPFLSQFETSCLFAGYFPSSAPFTYSITSE